MYIADLHIHSRFSRATSKDGDLPHLDWWARRKGIQLIQLVPGQRNVPRGTLFFQSVFVDHCLFLFVFRCFACSDGSFPGELYVGRRMVDSPFRRRGPGILSQSFRGPAASAILSCATSEGDTPGMRPACPRFFGRMRASFSRASSVRPVRAS